MIMLFKRIYGYLRIDKDYSKFEKNKILFGINKLSIRTLKSIILQRELLINLKIFLGKIKVFKQFQQREQISKIILLGHKKQTIKILYNKMFKEHLCKKDIKIYQSEQTV